jgi:hypothetical protein
MKRRLLRVSGFYLLASIYWQLVFGFWFLVFSFACLPVGRDFEFRYFVFISNFVFHYFEFIFLIYSEGFNPNNSLKF